MNPPPTDPNSEPGPPQDSNANRDLSKDQTSGVIESFVERLGPVLSLVLFLGVIGILGLAGTCASGGRP